MRDRMIRYVVLGALMVGLFAGFASQEHRVSAVEGEFSSASVEIYSVGHVGHYSLPEPSGYSAVGCDADNIGYQVAMSPPGFITVTANDLHASQTVKVSQHIYQKLADGSYSWVDDASSSSSVLADHNLPSPVQLGWGMKEPYGPDYVLVYRIEWWSANNFSIEGLVLTAYSHYYRTIQGVPIANPNASVCGGQIPPMVEAGQSTGTVNSTFFFTIQRYPLNVDVPILWDGKVISTVKTGAVGIAIGNIKVPAAPMGPHTIQWKYGHWNSKVTYTVKPRIKVIPSAVSRGQTVNISLRGYAKYETVNIRWKKGASWVSVAQVKTSGTGSANVNIKVPTWAPNGAASVRGDSLNASGGHAQTNAVSVSGGAPLTGSAVKTPTPTKTPAATPAMTTTPTPEVSQTPEATPEPIESATSEEQTPAPEPSESPATATPAPTETATPEPTVTEPAEPTTTHGESTTET